jgi:hypothetical protein
MSPYLSNENGIVYLALGLCSQNEYKLAMARRHGIKANLILSRIDIAFGLQSPLQQRILIRNLPATETRDRDGDY